MADRREDACEAVRAIEAYLGSGGRGTVEAVVESAAAVAAGWEGDRTADREDVVVPLARELDRRGVREDLSDLLAGAAEAAGLPPAAPPVPAPPYVVVTSTGPVLRATVPGGRIAIRIGVFEVERGDPTRYRLGPCEPEDAIEVEFRPGP